MAIGLLLIGIPVILAVVQMGLALVAGIKIWRSAQHQIGPRRTTLRLLGFNLIEPTSSAVLIVLLLYVSAGRYWDYGLMEWGGIPYAVAITLPVSLLLLPFAWAASSDPIARAVNIKLGILGIVRWAVTAITFVIPFAMILGLIVLGFSLRWVKQQAYQTVGAHYQAVGLGPEGVMVGELHDFGSSNQPHIRP
jgi:hypothetical protein